MRAAVDAPSTAGINCPRPTQLVVRTVRGRRAMEELVAMMAHRRRCEVAAVAERHVVSRFAHKGRIQSMLRLRLLRQGVKVKDEVWTLPRPVRPRFLKSEPEACIIRNDNKYTDVQDAANFVQENNGKCIADDQHKDAHVLAEKSNDSGNKQYDGHKNTSGNQYQEGCVNMVKLCAQNQEYSEASSFVRYDEHSTVDDVSPSTISTLRELCTPSSRGDTLREEDNQSLNGSWEERALWISSLGWPAPVDAMSPDSWNQDTIENHTQIEFNDRPWIDSPNSWRSLCVATQADSRALSGNADICNLLESKKVSKSLESDFSNKMNNLLLTILHKQRQQHMIDDFEGYYNERLYWRQNDEPQNVNQEVSAPCSLAPVSHLGIHQQESWQHSTFEHQHHENQNFLEMEVRVRSEMAQVHHEIYELRKLVESCIASQVKIQHSIKEEVCSALREAGLMPSQPDTTAKRGSCCICHQTQVDSLLYRCGHMCTCFNCADQLKSSSRSCPICQSPIEDVVRAHMNF
uniref:RING-type domain-containing protein n=2 Tax=Oryza brachyantha TaxID=4533 RepID=J3ML34_ORYBR